LGQNWTAFTGPGVNNEWESVAYGNGIYVAVSSTGTNRVMTSTDGENWTVRPSSNDSNAWKAITFGGGKFVAIATSGTNRVMTSTDGITWTGYAAADDGGTSQWQMITHGGGRYVAVNALGATPRFMVSTNGETWTGVNYTPVIGAITHDGEKFIAAANSGGASRIRTSTDGQTWLDVNTPNTTSSDIIIFFTPTEEFGFLIKAFNTYYLQNRNGSRRHSSKDLTTWTNDTNSSLLGQKLAFGNDILVGITNQDQGIKGVFYATTSEPSTGSIGRRGNGYVDAGWSGITSGDRQFVAVAKSGSQRILRSNPCP
jgi:hypothetical protein